MYSSKRLASWRMTIADNNDRLKLYRSASYYAVFPSASLEASSIECAPRRVAISLNHIVQIEDCIPDRLRKAVSSHFS